MLRRPCSAPRPAATGNEAPRRTSKWAVATRKALEAMQHEQAAPTGGDDLAQLAASLEAAKNAATRERAEGTKAAEKAFEEHDNFYSGSREMMELRFAARAPLNRATRANTRVCAAAEELDLRIDAFVARALGVLQEQTTGRAADVAVLQRTADQKAAEEREFTAYRVLDRAAASRSAQIHTEQRRAAVVKGAATCEAFIAVLTPEIAAADHERIRERYEWQYRVAALEDTIAYERQSRREDTAAHAAAEADALIKYEALEARTKQEASALVNEIQRLTRLLDETQTTLSRRHENLWKSALVRDRAQTEKRRTERDTLEGEIRRLRHVQDEALTRRGVGARRYLFYESLKSKRVQPLQPDASISWRGQLEGYHNQPETV